MQEIHRNLSNITATGLFLRAIVGNMGGIHCDEHSTFNLQRATPNWRSSPRRESCLPDISGRPIRRHIGGPVTVQQ
jgi:hypothetical protein